MSGPAGLIDALAAARPGERATLTIVRDATPRTVSITLGTQPAQASAERSTAG